MRIDKALAEAGRFSSRTRAAEAVKSGAVLVNGKRVPVSYELKEDDAVEISGGRERASRGAYKLLAALSAFGVRPEGRVAADVGASNGGFTEVLLEAGASHVYAVDVGKSQLAARLAADPRVTVMDETNARFLAPALFPAAPDLVVIDVSFISLTLVLPAVASILAERGEVVALVKPQFEAGRRELDKHGVVKSRSARHGAVKSVAEAAAQSGLYPKNVTAAPVKPGKNVEYLLHMTRRPPAADVAALLEVSPW